MIFYLTSDVNQERFDFLKETHILKKDMYQILNRDTFLKYIKKDIRNIELDFFLIDMTVFEIEDYSELCASVDAFFLLNPESKIIIVPEDKDYLDDLIAVLGQDGLFFIHDIDHPEAEIYQILNNKSQEEAILTEPGKNNIPANDIDIEILQETQESIADNDKKEEPAEMAPDNKHSGPVIKAETIYEKAKKPVKISEGNPLKKSKKDMVKTEDVTVISKHTEGQEDKKENDKKATSRIMNLQEFLYSTQGVLTEPENTWKCKNIMIGIIGTEKKIGTTTAAFHLAYYLKEKGAVVSYSEANANNHLKSIAEEFEFTKEADYYKKDEITFFTDNRFDLEAGVNFILFDLGNIAFGNEASYEKGSIRNILNAMQEIFLITGSHYHERERLDFSIEKVKPAKINLLFNFTADEKLQSLREKHRGKVNMVSNIAFEPAMDKPGMWKEEIYEIFCQYRQGDKISMNR